MTDQRSIARSEIKDIIQSKTNETHAQSRMLSRFVEIKFDIEENNNRRALEGMLAIILRHITNSAYDMDDLTRLLNTQNIVGTSVRELLFKSE